MPWTQHLYVYVGNNPVNYTDPTGHCPWCIPLGIWALANASDIFELAVDTVDLIKNPSPEGLAAVAMDAISLAAPGGQAKNDGPTSARLPKGGVYTLSDPQTGNVVRTGRTNDLERRQAEHARDPVLGQYAFNIEHRTDDYSTQRGLEQMIYDDFPDAHLNKVRPVSPTNPNRGKYMTDAYWHIIEGSSGP